MFVDIRLGKRWSQGIGLVKWDQMTQQYTSQTTFGQNTLGGRNTGMFWTMQPSDNRYFRLPGGLS